MYVQFDKETPCAGSIIGLIFAAVRPTNVQMSITAVSEWIRKLSHKFLHQPALAEVIRIFYINIIHYIAVTECCVVHEV
jgi:hypothetical protein